MTFSPYYFFNSKVVLICFLQFIFVKRSNNFFSFKITDKICARNSVFNFFNQKKFFRRIWYTPFCKNVFMFWHSNNITDFKFRFFIINFFTRFNIWIWAWFYIIRYFIVLWYVLLYLPTISSNLPIYTIFNIEL